MRSETAQKPAASLRASLPVDSRSRPLSSPHRRDQKSQSAPGNSCLRARTLRDPRHAYMHPPPPQATDPKLPPSHRYPRAPLPACTFRAYAPIAPHPKMSANQPPPAPNTRPNCAPPQNPGAIPVPPPRETPPPSSSKSQVGCSRSASILLPCLRSTFSKWRIPAPGPLLQTRLAPRRTSPPVLCPFPGISKLVPEKQKLLFPCFLSVAARVSLYARSVTSDSSCSIFSFMLALASPAATRIAFLIAFAFERPCSLTHSLLTFISGAPPYSV